MKKKRRPMRYFNFPYKDLQESSSKESSSTFSLVKIITNDKPDEPNEPNDPNEPNEQNEPNEPNEPNDPNDPNYPNEPNEPNEQNDSNDSNEPNVPKRPQQIREERRNRFNAKLRRLVKPKAPLMVFNELCKGTTINVYKCDQGQCVFNTACFEVDGQVFKGRHANKSMAKQKACENYFRYLLEKQLNTKLSNGDGAGLNLDAVWSNMPESGPTEHFPWAHFASLGLHKLIINWKQRADQDESSHQAKSAHQDNYSQSLFKIYPMQGQVTTIKQLPNDAAQYNPVDLLYKKIPDIMFYIRQAEVTQFNKVPRFDCVSMINGKTFSSTGFPSKKKAKRDCALQIIKELWKCDLGIIKTEF